MVRGDPATRYALLAHATSELRGRFKIGHATIQLETVPFRCDLARANKVSPARLLHVTLQHREQLAQLPLPFRRAVRLLDAVMDVRMNQLFREGFQAAPGGDDLGEDFRAVAILIQHPLDGAELAGDLAHADDGGAAFLPGVLMTVFFAHAGMLRAADGFVKKWIADKGYGGMLLSL